MKLLYDSFIIKSRAIKGNLIGNSKDIETFVVHGKETDGKPILIFLPGFLGTGKGMLFNEDPLAENMKSKLERLYIENKINGSIYAFPNITTNIGGCQYTNSKVTGNYEDFIIKELIPALRKRYGGEKVGILGKSSGGYAAITLGMKHSKTINAVMDHSGDAYFEYCYLPDFPIAREAIEHYGSAEKWLEAYMAKENRRQGNDITVLNIVAMAAYYSKSSKIELPFDLHTGELIEGIWGNWLSKDPVRLADKYSEKLKDLNFVGIDIGLKDILLLGNRILHRKLKDQGIKHFYEEFNDAHMNTSYRYDVSIPIVEKALQS